jgi:hypothetical protein
MLSILLKQLQIRQIAGSIMVTIDLSSLIYYVSYNNSYHNKVRTAIHRFLKLFGLGIRDLVISLKS